MNLSLQNTTVTIGKKIILKNIHYKVIPQTFTHIKGNNGSGKTVFLQTLLGFYKVKGKRTTIYDTKQIIYIPDTPFFHDNTTLREVLLTYTYFYSVSQDTIQQILEFFEINHPLNLKVSTLSLGTQKKLMILPLFFEAKSLYVLDEITLGLDDATKNKVIERLIDLHHQQKTILITEHNENIIHKIKQSIHIKEVLCQDKKIISIF